VFAVSQIIAKNLAQHKNGGSALWINPERDDCWLSVRVRCNSLKLFCQDYAAFTFLQQTGAEVDFSAFPATGEEKYDWVIMNLPRQKALLAMLLDCAASLLAEGGVLWLAGENRAGIKSADKLLKLHFGRVRKLDNARHCGLLEAGEQLHIDGRVLCVCPTKIAMPGGATFVNEGLAEFQWGERTGYGIAEHWHAVKL